MEAQKRGKLIRFSQPDARNSVTNFLLLLFWIFELSLFPSPLTLSVSFPLLPSLSPPVLSISAFPPFSVVSQSSALHHAPQVRFFTFLFMKKTIFTDPNNHS